MNERIRELATQAREYTEKYNSERGNKLIAEEWTEVYNEKFAELIVGECMAQCLKVEEDDESGVSVDALLCREEIRKHFGVEE